MSRYNRKVNAVLQAARFDRAARFVLAVLGGPDVRTDPFILTESDDFADAIQATLPKGAETADFEEYAENLADVAFPGRDLSDTGYAATLFEYLDGGYPDFSGGIAAPIDQLADFRVWLGTNSDYDTDVTGLGVDGDPLAKLLEYVVAQNPTFPA